MPVRLNHSSATSVQSSLPQPSFVKTDFKKVRREVSGKYQQRPPLVLRPPAMQPVLVAPSVSGPAATDPTLSLADHLRGQFRSLEFWLGLSCGLLTRLLTKFAVHSILQSADAHLAAGFLNIVACAAAGLAAGIAVHWVKLAYRNRRTTPTDRRERYWTKAALASAVTGLLGGILGGCVADVGALVVRAGSLAVSVSAGAVMGVPYALAMETRTHGATRRWRGAALQGAVFGAVGGMMGIVSADIFGTHSPATVIEQTSKAVPLPPAVAVAAAEPPSMMILSPPQPVQIAHHTIIAHVGGHPHAHALARLAIVRHVRPHTTPSIELAFEPNQPLTLAAAAYHLPTSANHAVTPPPAIDPNQPALKGPCAEPGAVCAERVIFDDDGNATKVVLDVRPDHQTGAHFVMESNSTAAADTWNGAAQDATSAPGQDDTVKISLIVPFATHQAAPLPGPA